MGGVDGGGGVMALGIVLLGVLAGVVAAVAALIAGAGFGMAFLAYAGGGIAGVGLAVLWAMFAGCSRRPRGPHPSDHDRAGFARETAAEI